NTGSASNSNGCSASTKGTLGIAVGYDKKLPLSQVQKDQDPCRVSNLCWIGTCANLGMSEKEFETLENIQYFDDSGNALNGYNLSGATTIRFELSGTFGNTFYASFCGDYAAINAGASQVGDLPTGNITGGKGFQARDGSKYYGTIEVSSVSSTSGYIVYSNGCSWEAATFNLVPNTLNNEDPEIYPPTYGDVACSITVNETTVSDCCIGVYPGQNVDVTVTMDTAGYNAAIIS